MMVLEDPYSLIRFDVSSFSLLTSWGMLCECYVQACQSIDFMIVFQHFFSREGKVSSHDRWYLCFLLAKIKVSPRLHRSIARGKSENWRDG
jgi:hypothetical protein